MNSKKDLLDEIERAWLDLNQYLSRLTQEQMTGPVDANGWSVKDHLIHLTAWERSMAYMLRGKPRHRGIGVDEDLYLSGTYDDINAEVYRRTHDFHLEEALAQFRYAHQDLLQELRPLTDADLHQPYRHYLPDEPVEGEGPTAYDKIYSNTADHFREHLVWIKALVG